METTILTTFFVKGFFKSVKKKITKKQTIILKKQKW